MGEKRTVQLFCGDCLDVMAGMEPDSADTIITDPPYGLEFMGKEWDHGVPGVPFWEAALRVAKQGAMMLAFGGTRTHHRLMCAIEDAGWVIRDCLMWLYGSGFPKSHDISKAIDKAAGAEREVVGQGPFASRRPTEDHAKQGITFADDAYVRPSGHNLTAPATPAAAPWDGWGTALKPAWEPIIFAMKPITGTFANNALIHGVAGLNIDGARIPSNGADPNNRDTTNHNATEAGWFGTGGIQKSVEGYAKGRWPANLLLDEHAAAMLDAQSGESRSVVRKPPADDMGDFSARQFNDYGAYRPKQYEAGHNDTGGASRFFYTAKASRKERNAGLEGMPTKDRAQLTGRKPGSAGLEGSDGSGNNPFTGANWKTPVKNGHPCVKPIALMRYLCRLTRTPTGGTVLDPFMGSGSTGCAAVLEGRDFVGIELSEEYVEIARRRIEHWGLVAEDEQAEMVQEELL